MNLNEFYNPDPNEKPLDHMPSDGGYAGILRSVVCVGDSLDSGEFEIFDVNNRRLCTDRFEYSWLSYFARFTGNEVQYFSRGGMSAKEYCTGYADSQNLWDRKKAANAYVITLGANDSYAIARGDIEFGEISDIDLSDWRNNKPTYVGYYGQIIQRYRQISPRCRIFVATPYFREAEHVTPIFEKQQAFLYEIAALFPFVYVMDFRKYASLSETYIKGFWMNDHMTPAGYLFKGRIFTAYIDYIIRHNLDDFAQLGMIGDEVYDPKFVW